MTYKLINYDTADLATFEGVVELRKAIGEDIVVLEGDRSTVVAMVYLLPGQWLRLVPEAKGYRDLDLDLAAERLRDPN